jgi:alginate production protein
MRVYAAFVLAAVAATPVAAQQIDYAIRSTGAFQTDDQHDAFYLNLAPRVLIEMNRSWAGYVRARVFLPTDRVAPFASDQRDDTRPARSFAGLNEFWIQYSGFTSYPGEALRIGRQRIRQTGSEWWDQDADAIRWALDSTLLTMDLGVAHQFSTYRTDDGSVPIEQRNRTYFFGNISADWRPEDRVGLRVTHAADNVDLPAVGTEVSLDEKLQDARLTWLGLYADSGFYDVRSGDRRFVYGGEVTYLYGSQTVAQRDANNLITSSVSQDVRAWQASTGLRWQPSKRAPVQVGAAYTYSEGGERDGRSTQFQQTGMQSNTSYFTGAQTLIDRYNEALRPELGNLLVASGFVSFRGLANEAGLVYSNFRRDSANSPIVTRNVVVAPLVASRDIGEGVDLVFTHYFDREARRQRLLDRGDAFSARERRSMVSLRGSVFDPGEAYGPDARLDYRAQLEVTLWLD